MINNLLFRDTGTVLAIDFTLLDEQLGNSFGLHIPGDFYMTKQHKKGAQPSSENLQH